MTVILNIHYHKTGTMINIKLIQFYKTEITNILQLHNPVTKRVFNKDVKVLPIIDEKLVKHKDRCVVIRQAAPNFFYNIFERMPYITKVVHYVREPYDWCLSNYLYHVQRPSPEQWIFGINPDIDTWVDKDSMSYMLEEIGLEMKDVDAILDMLKTFYKCPNGMKYRKYLINLPIEKGLLVETARYLINNNTASGCDHLRAAIMTKYLKKCDQNKVMTMHMTDFREDKIKNSIKKIGDNYVEGGDLSEQSCDNVYTKFKRDYERTKRGNHYTQKNISKKEKQRLVTILKEDPAISKLLNRVSEMMYDDPETVTM